MASVVLVAAVQAVGELPVAGKKKTDKSESKKGPFSTNASGGTGGGSGSGKAQGTSPIVRAIEEAEKTTSAEIRVHLSRRIIELDPLARAEYWFLQNKMHETKDRNGVLLYINIRRHKFAVFGDQGITKLVGPDYWNFVATELGKSLKINKVEDAIALIVTLIGLKLSIFFPPTDGHNANELSNEVSTD